MKWNRKPIIAISCAAIFSFLLAFTCSPDWGTLAGQAAIASAMLAMPDGSIALLQNRFADKLYPAPETSEEKVTPYIEPWIEPTTSSIPEKLNKDKVKPKIDIPKEYCGKLLEENMSNTKSPIRNSTSISNDEVESIIGKGLNIKLENIKDPQILIVHTHATECYEPVDSNIFDTRNTWRSTDNSINMVAVGDALEKKLKTVGIGVVHDRTQHDYPSYNGAYERSATTVKKYLKQYPSIKIVFDVHRDAVLRDDNITVKPVVEINGKKAAQVMIITGCEDGTMGVPNWKENLRFAASFQKAIENKYPQLTRPLFFCYRKYNMDLTTGSLLLEIGSNANTLEESVYSAEMLGDALIELFKWGKLNDKAS